MNGSVLHNTIKGPAYVEICQCLSCKYSLNKLSLYIVTYISSYL